MTHENDPLRLNRSKEQEAVRTTIVGGRPPGSGGPVGDIPRGIEVLVKKAAVDPQFKALLLDQRGAAAETIGLALEPAEAMVLQVAPAAQLKAIIARTSVPDEQRCTFLGKAAAAMLAVVCGSEAAAGIKAGAAGGVRPTDPKSRVSGGYSGGYRGVRPDTPTFTNCVSSVLGGPTGGSRIVVPIDHPGNRYFYVRVISRGTHYGGTYALSAFDGNTADLCPLSPSGGACQD